jgi:hypothetical protein
MNLMNIRVANDQAEQRFGPFERGCDLGGKTSENGFVNRARGVYGEGDNPMRAALVAISNR